MLIVSSKYRVETASIKEIDVGNKVLTTLQTLPKIRSERELSDLSLNMSSFSEIDGLVFDLVTFPSINRSLKLPKGQLTLDLTGDTPLKKLLKEKVVIIDPNMETLHIKLQSGVKVKGDGDETRYRRDDIFQQKNFPKHIADVFIEQDYGKIKTAWLKLEREKKLLALTMWYVDTLSGYGADLIIPPSPCVDGSSNLLSILTVINQNARELVKQRTTAYCTYYVPILPEAFDGDGWIKIYDNICDNIKPNDILVLKFIHTNNLIGDSIKRGKIKLFLSYLDQLKMGMKDKFAIMVLDTRSESLPLMVNGVDFTCDPLGGVSDRSFRRKKKIVDDEDNDVSNGDNLTGYGKYYHPTRMEYIKLSDFKDIIPDGDGLPCSCEFCKSFDGCQFTTPDHPQFPSRTEWNEKRRLHNLFCKKMEDDVIRNCVKEEDVIKIYHYIKSNCMGDKNLLDLLPNGNFL